MKFLNFWKHFQVKPGMDEEITSSTKLAFQVNELNFTSWHKRKREFGLGEEESVYQKKISLRWLITFICFMILFSALAIILEKSSSISDRGKFSHSFENSFSKSITNHF